MDVRKLVKVYNYVNDEKRSRINLKFAAALVAFVLTGALLVGFVIANQGPDAGAAAGGAGPAASAQKTDYVGLSTEEIQAGQLDTRLVDERWADWRSAHPDAQIDRKDEVRVGVVLVGYRVTYHEP